MLQSENLLNGVYVMSPLALMVTEMGARDYKACSKDGYHPHHKNAHQAQIY